MRSLMYAALLLVSSAPGTAGADCACLCVDGVLQTLCTSLPARRNSVDLCRSGPAPACPVNGAGERARDDGLRRYPGAVEGAVNCRDAEIFDPVNDAYVVARVCDAAPGG